MHRERSVDVLTTMWNEFKGKGVFCYGSSVKSQMQ